MRLKQTISALAVLLCLGGMPVNESQAEPRDDDSRERGTREREQRDPQIIIRSDADKRRRNENKSGNDNSNRQSDPDSTRGLDRAEERRPAHAGNDAGDNDDGWYEYLFGKRQNAGTKSERGWYEYLFGNSSTESRKDKNKDKEKDKKNDDSNWWWPFD